MSCWSPPSGLTSMAVLVFLLLLYVIDTGSRPTCSLRDQSLSCTRNSAKCAKSMPLALWTRWVHGYTSSLLLGKSDWLKRYAILLYFHRSKRFLLRLLPTLDSLLSVAYLKTLKCNHKHALWIRETRTLDTRWGNNYASISLLCSIASEKKSAFSSWLFSTP